MKRVTLSSHKPPAVTVSPNRRLPAWLSLPYAAWAGITFLTLAICVLVGLLLLPDLRLRRRFAHRGAQFALWVAGMRVVTLHAERLPATACVVVANHASYLDGVVLFAALPPTFGFVIKREMDSVPLAGLLLRRVGSHFVDRGGASQGKRDARALMREARAGGAMAFFAEGTFHHQPGLARFRPGAFVIAAKGGLPIVPVAIRGTRKALPPGRPLPSPERIEVELAPPIPAAAAGDTEGIAQTLRAARQAILARIPEPDLAPEG